MTAVLTDFDEGRGGTKWGGWQLAPLTDPRVNIETRRRLGRRKVSTENGGKERMRRITDGNRKIV